jgi:hypothetical protein
MPPKDRNGKLQVAAWLDEEHVREIDRRVAELQVGRSLRISRSDVLRQIVEEWILSRRRPEEPGERAEQGDGPSSE